MTSFPSYPAYRDAFDWLNEIPDHWKTIPVGRLYTREKRSGFVNEELLSVYRDHGVIPKSSRDDNNNKPSEDLSPYQLVSANDLVLNKMKAWQGSIAVSKFRGIVSPAYFVYTPLHSSTESVHSRYVHYLLRSRVYIAQYARHSKGIRVSQWDLDPEQFKEIPVLVPSSEEQQKIANFLDHETAKIDTLIEKQQQLIKLLKEKRQAVISHAVTKGLNPDSPLKDSGVEWLGEVPAGWGIQSLRHLGVCQNGINIGAEYFGTGFPFVSYGDVYRNEELPRSVKGLVQSSDSDREKYSVEVGDVFFTRTSETVDEIGFASTCLSEIGSATFAGFLIRFRPAQGKLDPDFSKYFFRNQKLRQFFVGEMNLVTRASLSQDLLKKMAVPIPPLSVQASIASYLDEMSEKFDALDTHANNLISVLKERRTALISAAVTGKIDVRNWQAPESTSTPSMDR